MFCAWQGCVHPFLFFLLPRALFLCALVGLMFEDKTEDELEICYGQSPDIPGSSAELPNIL